ncbi:hypothetical protein Kpol_1037p16 [Vanderwaltozyma polyspora DSM 70294]|uniref:Coenzyme Q-binding protein COQ10 START domain-containing protein n=1 Tax=Vanderwaltozyma polyspora (strain ATCC 22028 / DSM 70294 / BCRC 21397 / CBS 2163 / NBRC 10782 / NRRL Y-8283 / UCD 57-17) TaxID=436907 RepID=A7TJV8_VANPO|nr:uncharacterized protein Kpol_1037p16 [Vanderwaltozyma polyspora DSM 70294]EDO17420.1 hypothetical protein Kpol_1037p16 [Vanderwaltozyma polyspora DSM 70294]
MLKRLRVDGRAIAIGRRTLFSNVGAKRHQEYVLDKTMYCSSREAYNVISEVSRYHEFLPYCKESFVQLRDSNEGRPTKAGLRIGFQQYDDKFVCDVQCNEDAKSDKYTVVAESISHNLFYFLSSQWTIRPHTNRKNCTEIRLSLKYQFKSALYNTVSGIFAKSATTLVMKAFEKRIFDIKRGRVSN